MLLWKPKKAARKCPICGKLMTAAKFHNHVYCSAECRKIGMAAKARNPKVALRAQHVLREDSPGTRERRMARIYRNARLAARDAAYARAFPTLATGDQRGRKCGAAIPRVRMSI